MITKLQRRRDELKEKYGNASPALSGFDAAVAELMPEMEKLREFIVKVATIPAVPDELIEQALTIIRTEASRALAAHERWKGEGNG